MSFETDLTAAALAFAGLTGLIGGPDAPRLTWLTRPQGEGLPAVTLQVISAPKTYTLATRVGLVERRVQVDVWAATPDEAQDVAAQVIAFADTLDGGPFQGGFVDDERDGFEPGDGPDADGSPDFYRRSLDLRIAHLSLT